MPYMTDSGEIFITIIISIPALTALSIKKRRDFDQ